MPTESIYAVGVVMGILRSLLFSERRSYEVGDFTVGKADGNAVSVSELQPGDVLMGGTRVARVIPHYVVGVVMNMVVLAGCPLTPGCLLRVVDGQVVQACDAGLTTRMRVEALFEIITEPAGDVVYLGEGLALQTRGDNLTWDGLIPLQVIGGWFMPEWDDWFGEDD